MSSRYGRGGHPVVKGVGLLVRDSSVGAGAITPTFSAGRIPPGRGGVSLCRQSGQIRPGPRVSRATVTVVLMVMMVARSVPPLNLWTAREARNNTSARAKSAILALPL